MIRHWKVPGVLDWSSMTHNPYVDVTKETTTLYASDRDVFLFLVDDTHPIEAGRLSNGDPDLFFRGFYCWNSEVGSKTLGIASFYLRTVCANSSPAPFVAGIIDMAGLAQKGGAVYSHLRIARSPSEVNSIHVAAGKADLVLGCDLVVSGARKSLRPYVPAICFSSPIRRR